MKKGKIYVWIAVIGILGFTFWRNYGVLPKGAVILDSELGSEKDNTNEQKELKEKIKGSIPNEGQEIKTSFGYYRLNNKKWVKFKEIWE
jgi:hypothetical protein